MKTQCWGDPMDYSDVVSAQRALQAPNKYICIRCQAQALTESQIQHKPGCPSKESK
jgi:cytochrome c-type biogenesis protein CcmH/NrfF